MADDDALQKGYIDWLYRPLVSLRVVGYLAMHSLDAKLFGVIPKNVEQKVETVAGSRRAEVGSLPIIWFGKVRIVEVFVFRYDPSERSFQSSVLLGAQLLKERRLYIDYRKSILIIK